MGAGGGWTWPDELVRELTTLPDLFRLPVFLCAFATFTFVVAKFIFVLSFCGGRRTSYPLSDDSFFVEHAIQDTPL